MNICVYGAASSKIDKSFVTACELLGKKLADKGHTLIFGGGASGVMGAVARGVHSVGGSLFGIVPSFFNVDGVLFENCTEIIYTDTMRSRKKKLEEMSDAFIVAPGGIGTYDEFFEILTLKSLDRHSKPIAIYNVNGYYDSLLALLKAQVESGFISKKAIDELIISDNAELILDLIK